MEITLTPHAQELLQLALNRHPEQSPAEIVEEALAERMEREGALSHTEPKVTKAEFEAWLQLFTSCSERIPG